MGAHPHMYTLTLTHMYPDAYTHNTHTYTHVQTLEHTLKCTRSHVCMHMHVCIYAPMHAHSNMRVGSCYTWMYMYACDECITKLLITQYWELTCNFVASYPC